MNTYYIIFQALRIVFLLLLFFVPLIYCIRKGSFKGGFYFTWIVWIVVFFVYGIFIPAIARLVEKATGEYPDATGLTLVFGFLGGWLPALIISLFGSFVHKLFIKKTIEQDTK